MVLKADQYISIGTHMATDSSLFENALKQLEEAFFSC
jgi:hypothetical protein